MTGCIPVNFQRRRGKVKEGVARRTVQGRPFDVYKRYFDAHDLSWMAEAHGFRASVSYEGRAFIAATLTHG